MRLLKILFFNKRKRPSAIQRTDARKGLYCLTPRELRRKRGDCSYFFTKYLRISSAQANRMMPPLIR